MLIQYKSEKDLLKDLTEIQARQIAPINSYLANTLNTFLVKEKIFPLAENYQVINLMSVIFWRIADGLETKDPWSNSVDPLTFILGASYTEASSLAKYSETEEQRQKEKSIGGHFGYFTQGLIRLAYKDIRSLENLFENSKSHFDVESQDGSIAIEVKSKWNTTKGDSREPKYKEMWKMRGKFKELYFAEVLARPGHNFMPEISLLKPQEWPNFWICNGEFIFQRAAQLQGIVSQDAFMKTLYSRFVGILWIFFKIHEMKQDKIQQVDKDIQKFQNWASLNIQTNSFKSEDHKILMRIFSEVLTEKGVYDVFKFNSKLYPSDRKKIKDLIVLRSKLTNFNIFSQSILSSLERFISNQHDQNFLSTKLFGHL
jgi:hypothetical protein